MGRHLGVVGLFVASQAIDRQELSLPKPTASAVEVPGGSEFDQARPETDPVLPAVDGRPAGEDVASVAPPAEAEDAPPTLGETMLQVPVPETVVAAPETLGAAPAEVSDSAAPGGGGDGAVLAESGAALSVPDEPGAAPQAGAVEPELAEGATESGADVAVPGGGDTAPRPTDTVIAALPQTEETIEAPGSAAAPRVASAIDTPVTPDAPALETGAALPGETSTESTSLPQVTTPSLPPVGAGAGQSGDAGDEAGYVDEDATDVTEVPPAGAEGSDVVVPAQPTAPAPVTDRAEADPAEAAPAEAEPAEAENDGTQAGGLPVVRRLGNSASEAAAQDDASSEETALPDTEATDPGVADGDARWRCLRLPPLPRNLRTPRGFRLCRLFWSRPAMRRSRPRRLRRSRRRSDLPSMRRCPMHRVLPPPIARLAGRSS